MSAADESPAVKVTLPEIYTIVLGVAADLAEIKANLNLAVAGQNEAARQRQDHEDRLRVIEAADPSGIAADVEDHESRMRGVERKVYAIPAASTVVAVTALILPFIAR